MAKVPSTHGVNGTFGAMNDRRVLQSLQIVWQRSLSAGSEFDWQEVADVEPLDLAKGE